MKIRLNEDYYFLCCDWCDTENRVLWAKLQEGIYCGACHKPINPMGQQHEFALNHSISAGLC